MRLRKTDQAAVTRVDERVAVRRRATARFFGYVQDGLRFPSAQDGRLQDEALGASTSVRGGTHDTSVRQRRTSDHSLRRKLDMVDTGLIELLELPAAECVVCGKPIAAGEGLAVRHGERLLRFKCPGCYARFEADPAQFLAGGSTGCCD